ncbi:hypothetical protein TREMEDRAFT_59947 [Tremella mesenterica DSM 1558]|uniref:uncharacterized protein n=1 Tax=Tremella mesenterica (strain ATCC 24925 / CBS 8224 / DSM 1558 / NBRC 9311 / NRRL Y-6157 / RJB 2259-6 / UBC 559-6) TaxID=578456 RepID=UPI0003F4971F|nr:uncharacterized protein TREMEDRAFT_59947 [Tremella mesenterica DSM 1558]EIW71004.1 hypothetical protein TREMEDRAFT_59947 [Tremella mesenterica DSM 1558]
MNILLLLVRLQTRPSVHGLLLGWLPDWPMTRTTRLNDSPTPTLIGTDEFTALGPEVQSLLAKCVPKLDIALTDIHRACWNRLTRRVPAATNSVEEARLSHLLITSWAKAVNPLVDGLIELLGSDPDPELVRRLLGIDVEEDSDSDDRLPHHLSSDHNEGRSPYLTHYQLQGKPWMDTVHDEMSAEAVMTLTTPESYSCRAEERFESDAPRCNVE